MRSLTLLLPIVLVLAPAAAASEPPTAAEESPAARTLYWIRHGAYDWDNDEDPDVGKALVPLGVAQARLVAARLRADGIEPDRLVASTMTRARQTAAEISRSFPDVAVEILPAIRECIPPTRRADVMAAVDPDDARQCAEQIDRAFESLFVPAVGRPAHDVLVAHGNVIRRLVTLALGVDPEAWLGMSIANCSLTVVRVAPEGAIQLLAFGDVGHLPPELRTGWTDGEKKLEVPE